MSRNCPNKNKNKKRNYHDSKEKALFAAFIANNKKEIHWIVDSGASTHMTHCESILTDKRTVTGKEVTVANNSTVEVKCAGNVKLSCSAEEKTVSTVIHNVEHVPDLCANLLSVRQMIKKGNKVVFENDECKIFDRERNLIATANVVDDLYRLNCKVGIPNKSESAMTVSSKFDLWHRRLGHICNENLKNVQKSSIGVDFHKGISDK